MPVCGSAFCCSAVSARAYLENHLSGYKSYTRGFSRYFQLIVIFAKPLIGLVNMIPAQARSPVLFRRYGRVITR